MAIPDQLTHTQVQPARQTGAYPAKVIQGETDLHMDTGHSMRTACWC